MIQSSCTVITDESRMEQKRQGTLQFPCAAYEYPIGNREADVLPWHWHKEFEIIHISEGCMKLQVPSRTVTLYAGELAVLNSDTMHSAQGEPDCMLQSFVFAPELVAGDMGLVFAEKYILPLIGCREFVCIHRKADDPAVGHFAAAFEEMRAEKDGWEFAVREHLTAILLNVYRQMGASADVLERKGVTVTDAERMELMMAYIHGHYSENPPLSEIAGHAGIGDREALRCFKRTIGQSPIRYMMKYKLRESRMLLVRDPKMNILQIAQNCGFESSSYYAGQFKSAYGCTPREYRRNALGESHY